MNERRKRETEREKQGQKEEAKREIVIDRWVETERERK